MTSHKTQLSVNIVSLLRAAEKRDIPWTKIGDKRIIQLGQGRFQERLIASFTSHTRFIGQRIAYNKRQSSRILGEVGLPVTAPRVVRSAHEAVRQAGRIGYPVVIKPLTGNLGRLVTIGISDEQGVRDAYAKLHEAGETAIVETFVEGEEHRMLVVGGELVAVAKRVPGHVVGDGRRTIEALVAELNADPRRGGTDEHLELNTLELDDRADHMLDKLGYTRKTVPAAGEVVYLRATSNRSTGGTSVDVTDVVHPDNRTMALRVAAATGLDVVGIDFITPDISRSYKEVGGAVCEVNAQPDLRAHNYPSKGKPRDVAGAIIDMLFPPGKPARIPTGVVIGGPADTITAYMLAQICKLAGHRVGMAVNGEVYIDGPVCIESGLSPPRAAGMVLRDGLIDAAIFHMDRRAFAEHGLGFDVCDVVAVRNADDCSKDSRNASEGAIHAVIDCARHAVVLDADDEGCGRIAEDVQGRRLVLVTTNQKNALVDAHLDAGGCAVRAKLREGEWVATLFDKGVAIPIARFSTGTSRPEKHAPPALNAVLFASAMAYAMGKSLDEIKCGVATCEGLSLDSLGSMRVWRGIGPTVFLDDIDRADSVGALCRLTSRLECEARRVLVIELPTNAMNANIDSIAAAATGRYDRYILVRPEEATDKDHAANRYRTALAAGRKSSIGIEVAKSDQAAIEAALRFATPQGLVAILTRNVERACRFLTQRDLGSQSRIQTPASTARPVPLPGSKSQGLPRPRSDREARITTRALRTGIEGAAAYLAMVCTATGKFIYRVSLDPKMKLQSHYNMLRHAGAIYALAQYCERRNDAEASEAMGRASDFLVRETLAPVAGDDRLLAMWSQDGAIDNPDPLLAKLGGAGLGLAALVTSERSRSGTVTLATLRRLGEFVLHMQKADGSFYSRYIPDKGGRNDEWTSLYYPGEAALGLLMLHQVDPDPRWVEGARKALAYLAQARRGETRTDADHWALLATAMLLNDHENANTAADSEPIYEHALQVARSMLAEARASGADDDAWGCLTADGRTCPTATRLEGLLATLTILRPDKQSLRASIERAVERGIHFLLRAQVSDGPFAGGMPGAIAPARAGNRKNNKRQNKRHHNVIRIDYVQHALSAMLHYETLFGSRTLTTRAILDESLCLGTQYFLRQQKPEGNFNYCYDWVHKSYSREDHQVRQAAAVWGLALIHQDEPSQEVRHAIEKAFTFFDRHSMSTEAKGRYVQYPGARRGDLGTVALMALAYIDYLRSEEVKITESERIRLKQRANDYLRFVVSARAPDGRFHRSYSIDDGQPYGPSSPYFDGESLLALVKAAKYLDRRDLRQLARDTADAGHLKNVEEALAIEPDSDITKGYYQWSSMSYVELATSGWPGTETYGDWLIDLAHWMIDVHGVLRRSRNTAYAFEGIVSAYQLAAMRGDTRQADKFLRVIERGLEKLTTWQVGHSLANSFIQQHFQAERDRSAIGGIQNHRREAPLRIDVVQHQMHAVILARRCCFSSSPTDTRYSPPQSSRTRQMVRGAPVAQPMETGANDHGPHGSGLHHRPRQRDAR